MRAQRPRPDPSTTDRDAARKTTSDPSLDRPTPPERESPETDDVSPRDRNPKEESKPHTTKPLEAASKSRNPHNSGAPDVRPSRSSSKIDNKSEAKPEPTKTSQKTPPTPPGARKTKQADKPKKAAAPQTAPDVTKKAAKKAVTSQGPAAQSKSVKDKDKTVTTSAASANSVVVTHPRTDDAVGSTQQVQAAGVTNAAATSQRTKSPALASDAASGKSGGRRSSHDEETDYIFGHIKQAAESLIADVHEETPPQVQQQPPREEPKQYMPAAHPDLDLEPKREVEGEVYPEGHPNAPQWFYRDPQGEIQGPFPLEEMGEWFTAGYFTMTLLVKRGCDDYFCPLGELIKTWNRIPFQAGVQPPPLRAPVSNVNMN